MRESMPPAPDNKPAPPLHCKADRDGDCYWLLCPQERDGEPVATGRHCPLDVSFDDWGDPDPEHVARRDAYLAAHPLRGGF